jgi:arsenate reductase
MNTVIFACVHNAGRSQMAAAWFNALADAAKARAISAGTEPGARVHPEVLEAMREVGMDLSGSLPQRLTGDLALGARLLVTMGCGEACPVVPGLKREDWPLEDPKGKSLDRVREIRDEVRRRVETLLVREGWRRSVTTIRPARTEDRARVGELLSKEGLPLDGVEDHFAAFVVAEDAGEIVGAAGLEVHGDVGLLRSVVVAPRAKGQGTGRRLTESILREAEIRGLRAVYLLTTTAEKFFPRFGFERIERAVVPMQVQASREFQGACPASATVMCLRLRDPVVPPR